MLNDLLGWGGRLNRLQYFLFSCALGLATAILITAAVFALAPHFIAAAGNAPHRAPTGLLLITAGITLPIFLWFSLMLQVKRIRDIGWNPLYVIPGWIALIMIDKLVALAVPSLAIAGHAETVVGGLLNLAMAGCLLFWPGAAGGGEDLDRRPLATGWPDLDTSAPVTRGVVPSVAPASAQTRGFGRRGLASGGPGLR